MRFKPLDFFKEGEILGENLVSINNQTLLKKNASLSQKLINRIKKMGFSSIYVKTPGEEALLEEEVKDVISPETRRKAISDVKDCVENFKAQISVQKQQLVYGETGQNLMQSLNEVSDTLIDELLNSDDLKISIMDIKSDSYYMYEHAINSAVLSIMIAVKMGLNMNQMRNIALASLLANVGYTLIPNSLYDHENPLSDADWEAVKRHPKLGYDLLSNNTNLNAHIKSMVLQHHERMDGSGYPNGSKGIVLKNNPSHPLRPVLRLFKHGLLDTSPEGYVNLLEKHNLTIERIIYD